MTFIPRQILSKTAFGELTTESKNPQVQLKFTYTIITDISQVLTNKIGSTVTVVDANAVVTAAGVANSFSQIRSKDQLRYAPGQGGLLLGTCIFTQGVANSSQIFGVGDDDKGFFWGFDETDFGILRKHGGSLEMKSINILSAATVSGNITITLDGSPVVIAVIAGDTIAEVTEKIVAEAPNFLNAGRGWEVHTDDNIEASFLSLIAEAAAGVFSFADTDGTGVTASAFVVNIVGATPTDSWIALDSGDSQILDPLDGTGPSGMTIDPTKGNVFKISFQFLGYGSIAYGVENPVTGEFIIAVRIQYANAHIIPSLENPDNPLTLIVKTETGYTGGPLTMKTASMAAFSEGRLAVIGARRSAVATKSITTTEAAVLILHNEVHFVGKLNKVSIIPDVLSLSTESTKTTIIRVIKEPTRVDDGAALLEIDPDQSPMQFSSVGTSVVGGRELIVFSIEQGSGVVLNLNNGEIILNTGDRIVFTARHTSGAEADVTISAGWNERA